MQNKIDIFHDGPTEDQVKNLISPKIKGFTFNPSIFKKLKITNYLEACSKYAKIAGDKPISLEVIADTSEEIYNQAKIISNISKNVYVKIPVMLTNGDPTYAVIKKLIKLNITAILTINQINQLVPIVENTENILSIFVGRIFDSGVDGEDYLKEILNNNNRKYKYLWASARMAFDIIKAERCGFDIITLTSDLIIKYTKFGKELEKISNDTVKQFYNDAVDSGFKI